MFCLPLMYLVKHDIYIIYLNIIYYDFDATTKNVYTNPSIYQWASELPYGAPYGNPYGPLWPL